MFYGKSVLVIDGKNINEPNLERAEDEKAQKRYQFPEVQMRRSNGRDP
jgi:hypothetical protein